MESEILFGEQVPKWNTGDGVIADLIAEGLVVEDRFDGDRVVEVSLSGKPWTAWPG